MARFVLGLVLVGALNLGTAWGQATAVTADAATATAATPIAPAPCGGLTARTQVLNWHDHLVNGILPPHGALEQGQIMLTFDDGPQPVFLPIVLDALKECGVKAHFFFVGSRTRRTAALPAGPALLKRVVEEGHMVGSHSMNHSLSRRIGNLIQADNHNMLRTEIDDAHELVMSTFGVWTPFIRFPYGHGWREPRAHRYIERLGLVHFFWNMSNGDSIRGVHMGADGVHQRALSVVRRAGRGILLAHERATTSESLRSLLMDLINEGYTFVTFAPQ